MKTNLESNKVILGGGHFNTLHMKVSYKSAYWHKGYMPPPPPPLTPIWNPNYALLAC